MLDGNHYETSRLVNELMNNAQTKHILDLIETLKPELSIVTNPDGGKAYCYNYKDIIFGLGDTVYVAMSNFSAQFYTKKP